MRYFILCLFFTMMSLNIWGQSGFLSWMYKGFSLDQPLPLSMSIMKGYIPEDSSGNLRFKASDLWGLDFNFRYSKRVCIGFGLGGFNREIFEDDQGYEYNISYVSARLLYFRNYKADSLNVYTGVRFINYIVTQDRAKHGLDVSNFSFTPEIGVLIPLVAHNFLDVSLMYQVFKFDELTHQGEGQRLKNVNDSQWVWAAKYYF